MVEKVWFHVPAFPFRVPWAGRGFKKILAFRVGESAFSFDGLSPSRLRAALCWGRLLELFRRRSISRRRDDRFCPDALFRLGGRPCFEKRFVTSAGAGRARRLRAEMRWSSSLGCQRASVETGRQNWARALAPKTCILCGSVDIFHSLSRLCRVYL